MRQLKKSEYFLGTFLLFVAMFPLATTMDGITLDFSPLGSITAREKISIQKDVRWQRRITGEYRQLCSEKVGEDPTFVCPDINNTYEVRKFLKDEAPGSITGTDSQALSGSTIPVLRLFQLNDHQRSLLRRYQRVRACPEGLDDYIPGFLGLCTSQINKGLNPLRGILNDRARIEEFRQKDSE